MAAFLRVIGGLLAGLCFIAMLGALRIRSARYAWLCLLLIGFGLFLFHMSYWIEVMN